MAVLVLVTGHAVGLTGVVSGIAAVTPSAAGMVAALMLSALMVACPDVGRPGAGRPVSTASDAARRWCPPSPWYRPVAVSPLPCPVAAAAVAVAAVAVAAVAVAAVAVAATAIVPALPPMA